MATAAAAQETNGHAHSHADHDHAHAQPIQPKQSSTAAAATALRAKQAPLKDSYKTDPAAAKVTLKSSGTLDSSTSITCSLSTGAAATKIAGLHPNAGGPDPLLSGQLCSGDMLLDALVACAGVTLKAVATALGIPIASGDVFAEGDLDFRGTMGVDRAAPVGFSAIRLGFRLRLGEGAEDVDDDKIERLGRLTERYCVVLQTIARKPTLSVVLRGQQPEDEDGIERELVWGQKL